ncbi:HIT family protein [Campylobacter pinnipediorum subsp. caledonicus]|uniref:HIT family protein n=1 Tax=Campylobacter pinnipediorum subsp. caledonicus TaxID=1874362 RepID=A0A1S6U6K6_9BACT|nr:HIT family protein [Campylobacter pinnipediorum]AQW85732.1 HIT family protein [Campylobacter pinnipediorum subsp. caledonicus]AQW87343.1 HIT family protein [Campylobacter pinnipediorum subsp. caledonicus]OPA72441.1 histidine triad (HIT) protein [Campylobacter pinnipediorum subsp. caledonicus]
MIYEDEYITIEQEQSNLPWIKIFSKKKYKELSDCDEETRKRLFDVMLIAEKAMIDFYKPEKINIASFGNIYPFVHIHVIARFKDDDYFPESVWGQKQRDGELELPGFDEFCKKLIKLL